MKKNHPSKNTDSRKPSEVARYLLGEEALLKSAARKFCGNKLIVRFEVVQEPVMLPRDFDGQTSSKVKVTGWPEGEK